MKVNSGYWNLAVIRGPRTERQTGAAMSANHLFLTSKKGDLPPDLLVAGKIPGSCVCH